MKINIDINAIKYEALKAIIKNEMIPINKGNKAVIIISSKDKNIADVIIIVLCLYYTRKIPPFLIAVF